MGRGLDSAGAVDARAFHQVALRRRHRVLQSAVRTELLANGRPSALALPRLNGSTGLLTGRCGYFIPDYSSTTKDYNVLASASYVTGSHAMKFGVTDLWGENSRSASPRANINTLVVVNTVIPGTTIPLIDFPFQVAVYNTPTTNIQNVNSDLGAYAQDAWTMNRLTLHYGARFEHFNASIPAESSPASTWIAARNFPEIKDVPNWNDWAVRFAAAYDLTGDGKTALKGNAGKYVAAQAAGFAQTFNGMNGATQTRSWNDANGDKTILNADGSVQTNEVIAPANSNFGQITSRPDPDLARGYNWEYSALIQRELRPRLSVTAGYYRRDFYNIQVTDNQNLALNQWTPYSINTPADSRLPLAGQPISMYTLTTGGFSAVVDNLVTFSTQNKTTYNGVEFTANARGDEVPAVRRRHDRPSCVDDLRWRHHGDDAGATIRTAFVSATPCRRIRTTRQGIGRLHVPVRHSAQRIVFLDPRSCRERQLHRDSGGRGPADHRSRFTDGGVRLDGRQPGRTGQFVSRHSEPARHAPRQDVPRRALPHPGVHGRLQRHERRHRRPRE